MNILDHAIKLEEDGRKLYEKLAAEAPIPELKSIFTLLAEEEQQHHDLLLARKNGEDVVKADSTVLQKSKNDFYKMLRRKDVLGILKGDPDGYLHMIKAEEEFIRLYEEMAKNEKNESAATLLSTIIAEEKAHLAIMENIYEFMESPRTFLAWGEFSNLKEL